MIYAAIDAQRLHHRREILGAFVDPEPRRRDAGMSDQVGELLEMMVEPFLDMAAQLFVHD